MATKSTILINTYQNNIDRVFNSSKMKKDISTYIMKYIDRNSEQLYYSAPTKRIQFNKNGPDGDIIMDSMDIDRKEMNKVIRTIESIRPIAGVLKEPVSVSITLLLREASIKKDKKLIDQLMMYLVLSLYWSIQFRQFQYEPNENLVRYTINNLSNKYYLKTMDNLFEALFITAENNHKTSLPSLVSKDDKEIITYIMNIRTRVSHMIVRFSEELYKNMKDEKYMNTVKDDTSEENFYEVENISGNIENLANNSLIRIIQNRPDTKLVRMCASFGKIPEGRFKEIVIGTSNDDSKKVHEVILGILINYVKENSASTIGTKKFMNESIRILSKSNTKDKNILIVKKHLEYFLTKYSSTYASTNREATKNGYKKALLLYFVMIISKVSNGK